MLALGSRFIGSRAAPRVMVLCYHSISAAPYASASPEVFEQHLRWLTGRCRIVRFGDLWNTSRSVDAGGREAIVALTFDDGYADNFEHAFPLLARYAVPATFFVTAGWLEGDATVAARFARLCGDSRARPLSWGQLAEMQRAGMDVGGHTYSHPNLARLTRAAVEEELRRSKAVLEDRLGSPVRSLAYPFGIPRCHFTEETMGIAARAGYESGAAITFTPVGPGHSRFAIPRFPVMPRGAGRLDRVVSGESDLLGVWQERAPLFLQRRRWDLDG